MFLLQLIFHVYAYTITGEKIVGEYTEIGDGSIKATLYLQTPK